MHHGRKIMSEVYKCPSSMKNYQKQYWKKLNYEIFFLKNCSEQNKIRYARKTKKRDIIKIKIKGNKLLWKVVKSLLYNKVAGKDKIHLIEKSELLKTDLQTAEILNNFFSNTVQNLDISRYSNNKTLVSILMMQL